MKKLSDCKIGDKVIFHSFVTIGKEEERLADMGIVPGCSVKICRIAPLGDPICIYVRDYFLTIRSSEAKEMLVTEN